MVEWFSDVIMKLVKFINLPEDRNKDFTEKIYINNIIILF